MSILVEIAREKVRETFRRDATGSTLELIDATVNEVAADAARNMKTRALVDDYRDATIAIAQRVRRAPLCEKDIVEMLENYQVDEALVALAKLTHIPAALVARAFHASAYGPLLFIVRAADLQWDTFRLLLISKAGGKPSEAMLEGARDAFRELTAETAKRLIKIGIETNKH